MAIVPSDRLSDLVVECASSSAAAVNSGKAERPCHQPIHDSVNTSAFQKSPHNLSDITTHGLDRVYIQVLFQDMLPYYQKVWADNHLSFLIPCQHDSCRPNAQAI